MLWWDTRIKFKQLHLDLRDDVDFVFVTRKSCFVRNMKRMTKVAGLIFLRENIPSHFSLLRHFDFMWAYCITFIPTFIIRLCCIVFFIL